MRGRNPADDRWCQRSAGAAKGEGCTNGGAADLCRKQLGVVTEPAAVAAGDQEIQDEPDPEQARRIVELSYDDKKDCGGQAEGGDHIAPAKHVAEPAAKVIGEDCAAHPDREISRRGLKSEMLFIGEVLRHPCRPADPGEEVKE